MHGCAAIRAALPVPVQMGAGPGADVDQRRRGRAPVHMRAQSRRRRGRRRAPAVEAVKPTDTSLLRAKLTKRTDLRSRGGRSAALVGTDQRRRSVQECAARARPGRRAETTRAPPPLRVAAVGTHSDQLLARRPVESGCGPRLRAQSTGYETAMRSQRLSRLSVRYQ